MITKAIVEQIIDNYSARVRVPIFDKASTDPSATPTDSLSTASICISPGMQPNIKVGDIVFVEFEDNNIRNPVIIGYLYKENMPDSLGDLKVNSLKVDISTQIVGEIEINGANKNDIENIRKSSDNLQRQIDNIANQDILENVATKEYVRDYAVEKSSIQEGIYGRSSGQETFYTKETGNTIATKEYADSVSSGAISVSETYTDGKISTINDVLNDKLDKGASLPTVLYGRDESCDINYIEYSKNAQKNTIVCRDSNGRIKAAEPSSTNDVATRGYVDAQVSSKTGNVPAPQASDAGKVLTATGENAFSWGAGNFVADIDSNNFVYGKISSFGYTASIPVATSNATAKTIPVRNANGDIIVKSTPSSNSAATSKSYVDGKVDQKITKSGDPSIVYTNDGDCSLSYVNYSVDAVKNTFPLRDSSGHVKTSAPNSNNDAVNKQYADNTFVAQVESGGCNVLYARDTDNNDFTYLAIGDGNKILTEDETDKKYVEKVSGKVLSSNDYTDADKNKLSGIEAEAEVNQNAFSKMQIIGENTSTMSADAKEDTFVLIAGSNITLTPTSDESCAAVTIAATYDTVATESENGLMSSTDKAKLNGIQSGAEVNQNAFSKIRVGDMSVLSDKAESDFRLISGPNVSLSVHTDEDCRAIFISSTDTTYNVASESCDGLMSSSDKAKLDSLSDDTFIYEVGENYIKYTNGLAVVFGKTTLSNISLSSVLSIGTSTHVYSFSSSDAVTLPVVFSSIISLNLSSIYERFFINVSASVETVIPTCGDPVSVLKKFSGHLMCEEDCKNKKPTFNYIIYGKWA